MDTKAMFKLTYGLFVLTTESNGKINGCITNTAIQVANDPTRIGLAVNKANYTEELIQASRKFNISVIGTDADFALFKRFGFQSGRDVDKFADFADYTIKENGIVQSMSRKGNCYDNSIMETFFGRLKNEMFYGCEKDYRSYEEFSAAIAEYIDYYNNERIQAKTKWMPPVKYRMASTC